MEMTMEQKPSPNQQFFPNDALIILQRGPATRREIADELGCSMATVYLLIVKLIEQGNDIGYDGDGYFLLDLETLDKDAEEKAREWTTRIYNMFIRLARRADAHKPVAKQLRIRVAGELSIEERRQLKKELLLLTRVIDAVDLEEELGD